MNIHPTTVFIPKAGISFDQGPVFKVEEVNLNEAENSDEEEKKPKKVKQIRKRNKVGLKYLETNFSYDNVKLENQEHNEMEED